MTTISGQTTVGALLAQRAALTPDLTAYQAHEHGDWHEHRWRDIHHAALTVAAALDALDIRPGERCAVLAATRVAWVLAGLGILTAGNATAPISPSSTPEQMAHLLRDSGAQLMFVENPAQLDKLAQVLSENLLVRHIVLLEGAPSSDLPLPTHSWAEFWQLGLDHRAAHQARVLARVNGVQAGDVASIVSTSGTTGEPRGAVLTHGNFTAVCDALGAALPVTDSDVQLLLLPLAHIFGRMLVLTSITWGSAVAFARDPTAPQLDAQVVRPTWLGGVPRFFEKVHAQLHGAPERLIVALGGRFRFAVSAGALLAPELVQFFQAGGVPILDVYGLTETTSALTLNRLGEARPGTVGRPLPGVRLRIAHDGEVLFRSPGTMREYLGKPEATAAAIDPDGWFHTGDIGTLDADGFLRLTDRKKDLIITSGGKNVAPAAIEQRVRQGRWVSEGVVYGDGRKSLTLLVTLDRAAVLAHAEAHGLDTGDWVALCRHPTVRALVEADVEAANAGLASFETIKRYAVLPSDFAESGDVTPTLKVRRARVIEKHRHLLDSLYEDLPAPGEARIRP